MIRNEVTMEEDLRDELLQIKKQFAAEKTDNQALKVSLRKLEDKLHKKEKQIEVLLNPEKSANFRKFVSDKGATMILNLKNKVNKMEKELREKDAIIKRLKDELEICKVYGGGKFNNRKEPVRSCPISALDIRSQTCLSSPVLTDISSQEQKTVLEKTFPELSTGDQNYLSEECEVEVQFKRKDFPKEQSSTRSSSIFVQTDETNVDNKKSIEQYEQLKYLEDMLKGIIGDPSNSNSNNNLQDHPSNVELKNHLREEMKQLHEGFQTMTSQVENLKLSISKLRSDQLKTENVLKKKDTTFEKMLDELKAVRKSFHNWPVSYTATKNSPSVKHVQRPRSNVKIIKLKRDSFLMSSSAGPRFQDFRTDGDSKDGAEENPESARIPRKTEKRSRH